MQLRVQRGLLLRARLELSRDVLAGLAVGRERFIEGAAPLGDRLRGRGQRLEHPRYAGPQRLGRRDRLARPLEPGLALGALALQALELVALGRKLRGQRKPPACLRAVVGGGPAVLDHRFDPATLLAGLVARAHRGAVDGCRALGLCVAPRRIAAGSLERRRGALLGLGGGLAGGDQQIAPVALRQHALLSDRGRLAKLAGRPRPDATRASDRDAGELLGNLLERLDDPGVAKQRPRHPHRRVGAPEPVSQPLRAGRRRAGGRRQVDVGGRGDQRTAALAAGAIEQRRSVAAVADDRGPQSSVQSGRERQLVARVDLELV